CGLRQTGDPRSPRILCSGITRPSSRMKSLHTSPHLTSFTTPFEGPPQDAKVMIWSSSEGHSERTSGCFSLGLINSCRRCFSYALLVAVYDLQFEIPAQPVWATSAGTIRDPPFALPLQ